MFDDSVWNLIIIVTTLGGLLGLYLLVLANGKMDSPADGDAQAGEPGKVETMGHVWDDDLTELNNPLPRWWVNMFYITLAFAVIYLLIYPGLGSNAMPRNWTAVGQYEAEMAAAEARYGPLFERYREAPVESLARDDKARRMGERLFASYCTGCHGSDAGGVEGFPNLRDGDWLHGGSPAAIEKSILDGRTGVMPPWGELLGDTGVAQVTSYVLSLSAAGEAPPEAQAGKARYAELCAACHGAGGEGNSALGGPNLTDGVWLYGGSREAITHSIALGRRGYMPPHRQFLGEAKAHLLTAFVWSLTNAPE